MNNTKSGWLLAGIVTLAGTVGVLAHGGATGIVKERMDGMVTLREQMRKLAPMLDNSDELTARELTDAAEIIAGSSGAAMTNLFPEDSLPPASEARARIWTDWDRFSSYANDLKVLAQELGALASQPEPVETSAPTDPPEERSEWEMLETAVLLGLADRSTPEVEPAVEQEHGTEPVVRPVAAVVRDIAATCAACHERYRRSE